MLNCPLPLPLFPPLPLPFRNTNTSEYILSYSVNVRVPAGDTIKSATLLSGSNALFSLSPKGFVTRGNSSFATGKYKGLATLKTAGGETYLAVVEAMIATPGSYSAQVASANAASGLASGVFAKKTANGQQHQHQQQQQHQHQNQKMHPASKAKAAAAASVRNRHM